MHKKVILLILIFMLTTCVALATDQDLEKVDEAGYTALDLVTRGGKWIILITGIIQVIKKARNADMHAIVNTVITYLMIWGAVVIMPWAFDFIEGMLR